MSQKLSEYFMLASLILSAVSFASVVIRLWPILQTHVETLLVHIGALLCITAVGVKVYRKQVVMRIEVLLLAAIMIATWYFDFSLIGKLVIH